MNKKLKLIQCTLDGQIYGILLNSVNRVLPVAEITPIPKSPAALLGVVNMHGCLSLVLDIREMLGLSKQPITPNNFFIVIESLTKTVLIVVDNTLGIIECNEDEILIANSSIPRRIESVKGIINHEDKLIMVLDIDKLINHSDVEAMSLLIRNKRISA